MDAPDNTTIPIKRCSKGNDCVHPKGPDLPATTKYYYRDKNKVDGLRVECKACNSKMLGVTFRPTYDVPDGHKRCCSGDKCLTPGGPVLPATTEYFHQMLSTKRLYSKCRACRREEINRWVREHPEQAKESQKKSHQKNADKIRERQRESRKRHPHPERQRERHARREARKRLLPATFTHEDWKYALEYFHGACAYCGNPPSLFDRDLVLHQEHHIPLARGGAYTPNNIIPACQGCNFSKGDRNPHEWIVWRFKRKAKEVERRLKAFFATVRQDTPASIARSHLSRSEKTAARREEFRASLPPTKRCSRGDACAAPVGPELPLTLEFFGPSKETLDGFHDRCRACERARLLKFHHEHKEELNAKKRQWKANHPDEAKENSRRYYRKNRDKLNARSAEWRRQKKRKENTG